MTIHAEASQIRRRVRLRPGRPNQRPQVLSAVRSASPPASSVTPPRTPRPEASGDSRGRARSRPSVPIFFRSPAENTRGVGIALGPGRQVLTLVRVMTRPDASSDSAEPVSSEVPAASRHYRGRPRADQPHPPLQGRRGSRRAPPMARRGPHPRCGSLGRYRRRRRRSPHLVRQAPRAVSQQAWLAVTGHRSARTPSILGRPRSRTTTS